MQWSPGLWYTNQVKSFERKKKKSKMKNDQCCKKRKSVINNRAMLSFCLYVEIENGKKEREALYPLAKAKEPGINII